jgi:hypothetical protein
MSTELYHYHAYGLNITSRIPLPCPLSPRWHSTDLYITTGKIDFPPSSNKSYGVWQTHMNDFFFTLPHTVSFHINSIGNQITIEHEPKTTLQEIWSFLISCAMAAVLYKKDILPLHACALEKNGKTIIFGGHAASGKSTTATYLTFREKYKLLTDDLCALSMTSSGEVITYPGFPIIKLWRNMAEVLEISLDSFQKVRPHLEKFFVSPPHAPILHDAFPVRNLYILTPNNSVNTAISSPLTTKESLGHLNSLNTMSWVFPQLKKSVLSQKILLLAKKIHATKIKRPTSIPPIDALQQIHNITE